MTSPIPLANAIVMPVQPAGEAASARMPAMSLNLRTASLSRAAASLGLGAVLVGATPAAGQPAPQRVTSDTPEFCLRLSDRVSELVRVASAPPPQEVSSLSSEGRRMCDQGHTRGGILRLRRALMMMLHQGHEP
jgi:hypothetical protein